MGWGVELMQHEMVASVSKPRSKAKIRPIRAEDFTIRFERSDGTVHKLFKLLFMKDGSLSLAFPYFPDLPGIVAVCTFPANQAYPTDISLAETGKVTSHLVKYSHHWSGEALFSQDGKVVSSIRKASVRPNSSPGHLFTIQLQKVAAFQRDTVGAADPPWHPDEIRKKTTLTLKWQNGDIDDGALKIVGRMYGKAALRAQTRGGAIGPMTPIMWPGGHRGEGFLLSPNLSNPSSSNSLLITGECIAKLTEEPGPHLTMVGGFDESEVVHDHSQGTSFLALNYPADDYEKVRKEIGTIDIGPPTPS